MSTLCFHGFPSLNLLVQIIVKLPKTLMDFPLDSPIYGASKKVLFKLVSKLWFENVTRTPIFRSKL